MSQKQSSGWCPHCRARTLCIGTAPNHLLHLTLTLLSCGLWAVVWLAVAAANVDNYRCARCGTPV